MKDMDDINFMYNYIINHNLTDKTRKIFNSCNSQQLESANKFAELAIDKIRQELNDDNLAIEIIFNRQIKR